MITNEERYDAVDKIRRIKLKTNPTEPEEVLGKLCACIDLQRDDIKYPRKMLNRIADLIENDKPLKYEVFELAEFAFSNMEGCDQPEWGFFSRLYDICVDYLSALKQEDLERSIRKNEYWAIDDIGD